MLVHDQRMDRKFSAMAQYRYCFDEYGQLETPWSNSSSAKNAYRVATWLMGLVPLGLLAHTFWQGQPGPWDWVELSVEGAILISWLGLRLGLTRGWTRLELSDQELRYDRGWLFRHRVHLNDFERFTVEDAPYINCEWVFRRPGKTYRIQRPRQIFAEDRQRINQVEQALKARFS
jgi:hypothetical protein